METSVILTIAVIGSGLISAQPFNEISLKTGTDEGHEMKNHLHNLFESISKNDVKNTGTYRSILGVQAAREQHAFNLLKENVEFARQKNADRQKHFDINNGNTHEKLVVFKRETPDKSNAGATCAAPSEKTAEKIEIESIAQQIQDEITNMTDPYDQSSAENIHKMWYNKMLEVEQNLRTNTAPVLKNEVEDSQVEFFAQRVRRKIDNWPDVEHPVAFKIHHMWYEKARDIEKKLKDKYARIPKQ